MNVAEENVKPKRVMLDPRGGRPREKSKTHIEGLDRILNGGIPIGNTTLLAGTVGSGKTTLAMEYLINGAKNGETTCYISVTEPSSKMLENLRTYGFFEDSLVTEGKLNVFDLGIINDRLGVERLDGSYTSKDMEALLGAFEDIVDELQITRLVIDSITAICYQLPDKGAIRNFIFRLGQFLATFGCTTMLISETVVDARTQTYSIFGVEEAVADGVILMGNVQRQGDLLRTLQVVKMRGAKHSRSRQLVELTPIGLSIVPLLKWGQDTGQVFT
jgi:circadian clock protein KaiC|tara:strand:- start:22 stop:843 length:822 start_codon:yes stop_codon:yes gene_type:complete